MAGSIHLGDLEAPALNTATERLGTSSSTEQEAAFERQAFRNHDDPASGGSRSMPGSFPEDTLPPLPTQSMYSAVEDLADPVNEEAHAPAAANADNRYSHAGQAAVQEASRPSGRLTRWSERNYKFGDMLDKALKPYTVPLTAGGLGGRPWDRHLQRGEEVAEPVRKPHVAGRSRPGRRPPAGIVPVGRAAACSARVGTTRHCRPRPDNPRLRLTRKTR